MEKDEFPVQSYTQKELAGHYRISTKTLKRWLKRLNLDLGTRIGNSFSPKQVKIITDHLGKPFIWIWIILKKMFIGPLEHHGSDQSHSDHGASHHGHYEGGDGGGG